MARTTRCFASIFAALLWLIATTACDSHNMLRSEIDIVKRDCPIDNGLFGVISDIEYNDENNTIILTLSPSQLMPAPAELKAFLLDFGKRRFIELMREDLYSLINQAIDDCAGFKVMLGADSLMFYSPVELEYPQEGFAFDEREKSWYLLSQVLQHELASQPNDKQDPAPLQGVVFNGCSVAGSDITYTFLIDDESFDNNQMADSAYTFIGRDVIHRSGSRSTLFKYIMTLGKNYRMTFEALPSHRMVDLRFTPAMLDSIFKLKLPPDTTSTAPTK